MAALHSLLPEDRVEVEADLVKARLDRDVLRDRVAQLEARGEPPVYVGKVRYQLDTQERWISRYLRQLGGTV